tara:strand:- start:229 stop:483 length:255 start_codon:yes stop_codon:yes gene_type:complete
LIGKAQAAVASEALKLTLTIDAAAHQNDAGWALVVPLHCTNLHPTLLKQLGKVVTDGVLTQTAQQGDGCPQTGQTTGHIRWCTT